MTHASPGASLRPEPPRTLDRPAIETHPRAAERPVDRPAPVVLPWEAGVRRELASRGGVTIVVPVYNEEKGVSDVLEKLSRLDLGVPIEVIAIDDGSKDRTPQVLAECAKRIANLRVVTHRVNQGYGAALKTGFTHARTDVVVITDADGTYPEERIRDLIACIDDGAEMAVGARTGKDVNIPFVRKPAKLFLKKLASFLAGTDIPDLNSGLRAFRRELVMQYRPILPQGFSFTTTITLASLTNGHRVDYVAVNYAKRQGSSKIRPIHDTLAFTSLIVRTVLYFNPLKVMYPAAFLVFVALCISLYYDLFVGEAAPNLADKTVLLFVGLVQVLTVGLLADLIEKRSRL
jgi:glycosyltransferase involved in cell wall biosynthesis